MIKEKTINASELAIDTPVWCWLDEYECAVKRKFAGLIYGKMLAFEEAQNHSVFRTVYAWTNMELEDGTKVLPQ